MRTVEVVGCDLAMANMGLAKAYITQKPDGSFDIQCRDLRLVTTAAEDKKVVRKSSNDLRRGQELVRELRKWSGGALFVFAEVPSGSMSAAGARSLGLATGALASLDPAKVIEVSPMEVKVAVTGHRKGRQATKLEIIEWAARNWPEGNWIRAAQKHTPPKKVMDDGSIIVGKTLPAGRLTNDNEHIADAMAAIKAGTMTPAFQQFMSMMRIQEETIDEITRPVNDRPAPGRRPRVRL